MSPKKKSTALATVSGKKDLALPSYIKAEGKGTENVGISDLTRPFLKLAQDKTEQLGNNGLKVGQFFNTTSGKVYGPEVELHVIVAAVGQMRFGKYGSGDGILCQAPDGFKALEAKGKNDKGKPTADCGECVLGKWVDGEAPACNRQYRFLVLVPGESAPQQLTLQRTQMPAARKLGSILKMSDVNAWAHKIKLIAKKTDKNWVVEAVKQEGWAKEPDYKRCEALYNSMGKAFRGEKQAADSSAAKDL